MAQKKKKKHKSAGGGSPTSTPKATNPRARGLELFQKQNYLEAIRQWESLPQESDLALTTALAEAYFRRGLGLASAGSPAAVEALRQAVQLVPDDTRYLYHLALKLHSNNQLAEAATLYERLSPHAIPGLAHARALAALELNPKFDIETAGWIPAETRAALRPVASLLRNEALAITRNEEITDASCRLWYGLSALEHGDAEAAKILLASNADSMLRPITEQIRTFYYGLTLAKLGKSHAAVQTWDAARQAASKAKIPQLPQLEAAIEWTQVGLLYQLKAEQRWNDLLREAQAALKILPEAILPIKPLKIALHRLGHEAAAAGQWKQAEVHWLQLSTLLEQHSDKTSPIPILRNIAIGNEVLEKHLKAALAWEKVLLLLPDVPGPRKKLRDDEKQQVEIDRFHHLWTHQRIIDLYLKLDQTDETLFHFKAMIKLAPANMSFRLAFARMLWDVDLETAARNELKKLLKRDPHYVPALLTQIDFAKQDDRNYDWDGNLASRCKTNFEETLRKVLSIEPANQQAREYLGELLAARGREARSNGTTAEVLEALTEAYELDSNNPEILISLADAERAAGLTSAYEKHIEEAITTGDSKAYSYLFFQHLEDDDVPGAQAVIKRANDNQHISHLTYIQFGIAALTQGESKNQPESTVWGEKLLEQAIVSAPEEIDAYSDIIELLGKFDTDFYYEVALNYASKITISQPKNPRAFTLLALAQIQAQQIKPALETLDIAQELAVKAKDEETFGIIYDMREMLEGSPLSFLDSDFDMFSTDD